MGIKHTRRREYRGTELDGNVFDWIVEECERIRYWDGQETRAPKPRVPALRSLRGNDVHHTASPRLNLHKSSSNAPGEHTFEISKARKL